MIETNVSDYPTLALYIDGKWLTSASGGSRAVVNPTDESVLALLPLAGAAELEQAVAAAQRGFALWKSTTASERHETLTRATRLVAKIASDLRKPLRASADDALLSATIDRAIGLKPKGHDFVIDRRHNGLEGAFALKPERKLSGWVFGGKTSRFKDHAEHRESNTRARARTQRPGG